MKNITLKFLFYLWLMICNSAAAQVAISPTNLFITDKNRFETLMVMNGSNGKQEISITYEFGFSESDDFGQLSMNYSDENMAEKYSVTGWLKGFPKNFVLEPGQRQVIRMTVRPPKDIAEGTYWTRIKTASIPESPPVGDVSGDGISAQVNFKFEQVTSLFYKVGNVSTSLEITDLRLSSSGEALSIFADITRGGNSPYLGTMYLNLYDQNGSLISDTRVFVSIYFDGTRYVKTKISELPSGTYTAEVTFKTFRDDIPEKDIIKAPDISQVITFVK